MHSDGKIQAESEFKNSNVGGKYVVMQRVPETRLNTRNPTFQNPPDPDPDFSKRNPIPPEPDFDTRRVPDGFCKD